MPAQDYGNISDYLVNGDNFERVLPNGQTLVIPGAAGEQPLIPIYAQSQYQPVTPCVGNTAAQILHEKLTGFYYIAEISTFDPSAYQYCDAALCALAQIDGCGIDSNPDCVTPNQFRADSYSGKPLRTLFPQWFLLLFGFTGAELAQIDFWFVGCFGPPIVINIIPKPPPLSCPPPSMLVYVNGVPTCMSDPPIPNHLPRAFRTSGGLGVFSAGKTSVPSVAMGTLKNVQRESSIQLKRELNPSLKIPLPFVPRPCACEGESEPETLVSDFAS